MALDKLRFYVKFIVIIFRFAGRRLSQSAGAAVHKFTYKAGSEPKNVIVVGGSFAGLQLVKRLTETLPSGYRVVLIEKNSHFNYSFVFPRFTVLKGQEDLAFIPYDGLGRKSPSGIFLHVHAEVERVSSSEVHLSNGESMPFEYLCVATGSAQPPPAKLAATDKAGGVTEVKATQDFVSEAKTIAVIGGGAVGVELAADIKSYHPEKFGPKLHDHVVNELEALGVKLTLGQRVMFAGPAFSMLKNTELTLQNGEKETYDLVVPCTGQQPLSGLLAKSDGKLKKSGEVDVKPTLQVEGFTGNIFAIGDVADTGGPKMARAGMMQAEFAATNIVRLAKGRKDLQDYVPEYVENALKLTLGKDKDVIYVQDGQSEYLIPKAAKSETLDAIRVWSYLDAKYTGGKK